MNTAKVDTGLKVKASIKAAGIGANHNRKLSMLMVKSTIKSAGIGPNHNRSLASF